MDVMPPAHRPELDPLSAARFARQSELYCVGLSLGRIVAAEVDSLADLYALRQHIQTCDKNHASVPGVTHYDESLVDRL